MLFIDENLTAKEVLAEELIIFSSILIVSFYAFYFWTCNVDITGMAQMSSLNKVGKLALLAAPITTFFAARHIAKIILYAEPKDLPFLVRFMKSGLFWFVLSAVGILIVFPKAVPTKEDIPRIIYLILLADFCTLFIKTWTFISPKSKIPTRAM